MMRHTAVALLALFVGSGCDSAASISVEPERPLLTSKDDTVQLKATVKDKQGKPIGGARVTYKSLTPTMAQVDSLGTVRAVTSGTATILMQSGTVSKKVDVLIQIPKKIVIDPESPMMMLGVTRGFKATVMDDRDNPMIAGEIRWTSSDPTIFTVDKAGNVKTLAEGQADLRVHAAGIQGKTTITVKHEELLDDGTLTQ